MSCCARESFCPLESTDVPGNTCDNLVGRLAHRCQPPAVDSAMRWTATRVRPRAIFSRSSARRRACSMTRTAATVI